MNSWVILSSAGVLAVGVGRLFQKRKAEDRSSGKDEGSGPQRARQPLSRVVAACEARWFLTDLQLAMAGDESAMVRVGHMLLMGYGVKQDPEEAGRWLQKAWALQNFKEPMD